MTCPAMIWTCAEYPWELLGFVVIASIVISLIIVLISEIADD